MRVDPVLDWTPTNAKIMIGKAPVAGTRITVELTLGKFAAGESFGQILSSHPRLTPQAIRAVIAFAAASFRSDVRCMLIARATESRFSDTPPSGV